ncbi:MAG: aminopeptidase P family protein [Vicinamibacterales bacterium]|nr:aminopeptidase P family protein [Vicinamibacterales bacterium]
MVLRPRRFWLILVFVACALAIGSASGLDQQKRPAQQPAAPAVQPAPPPAPALGRLPAILTLREQAEMYNAWLTVRLERLLPDLMRQEGFDMWIVICRENNEDPVFTSLVPFTTMYASRTSILVFTDTGPGGIERLTLSRAGIGQYYKAAWDADRTDQWTRLGEIIKERSPKKIGINESETFNYGDGITATLKKKFLAALPSEFQSRVQPAERLAIRWLERRTPDEMEVYPHIVAIGHAIIAEAFSRTVITPGVTTTDDVVWYFRERSRQLGLTNWFQPSVDIQRPRDTPYGQSSVIHRGDLLHCDFGIEYLKLCTDTQEMAYVLKDGEVDVPKGLQTAFAKGNRLQDIHLAEMRAGLTGNAILAAILKRARAEGLQASVYTHPIGIHGHAAGTIIGLWDKQDGVPGLGDFPLFEDTAHSVELSVRSVVAEWGNIDVRIPLEQNILFRKGGASWMNQRQTAITLIR